MVFTWTGVYTHEDRDGARAISLVVHGVVGIGDDREIGRPDRHLSRQGGCDLLRYRLSASRPATVTPE